MDFSSESLGLTTESKGTDLDSYDRASFRSNPAIPLKDVDMIPVGAASTFISGLSDTFRSGATGTKGHNSAGSLSQRSFAAYMHTASSLNSRVEFVRQPQAHDTVSALSVLPNCLAARVPTVIDAGNTSDVAAGSVIHISA